MPRPLPRWLFVLIGLVIMVVVGSVVLFSTNILNRAAVNTSATPTHTFVASSALTATAQARGTSPAAPLTPAVTTSKKTVFLIMMENHNWSDIKNNSSAPYINNTLNSTSTLLETIQVNQTICGWRLEPILVSIMTLTHTPIIRAQRNILLPS